MLVRAAMGSDYHSMDSSVILRSYNEKALLITCISEIGFSLVAILVAIMVFFFMFSSVPLS